MVKKIIYIFFRYQERPKIKKEIDKIKQRKLEHTHNAISLILKNKNLK